MKKARWECLIIEMEHDLFLIDETKQTAKPLVNFDGIEEDAWIITDLNGTPPRFQWVETPPKYAEILAQRRLQEAGELEEGAHLIAHWKQSRSQTASQIFFTAVPSKVFLTHSNRADALETHYMLFPCNAVLLACLNHFSTLKEATQITKKGKKTKALQKIFAILFEHGRHVDLLIGRSGHVLGAGRVSSFSDTPDARELLSSSVSSELRNIMESTPHTLTDIVYFNWLLSAPKGEEEATTTLENHADWVITLAHQVQAKATVVTPQCYTLPEKGAIITSLPNVLPYLSDSDATITPLDRLAYRTQHVMPWVLLITLLLIIALGSMTVWIHVRQAALQDEIATLQKGRDNVLPKKIQSMDEAYKKIVTFVQDLERWQRAPSFWMLLSDLSSARVTKLFFDQVTIKFDDNFTALVTLTGAIETSFQTANKDHEIFLAELTKRHFKVVKSNFSTDVTQLTFEIKLERPVK